MQSALERYDDGYMYVEMFSRDGILATGVETRAERECGRNRGAHARRKITQLFTLVNLERPRSMASTMTESAGLMLSWASQR